MSSLNVVSKSSLFLNAPDISVTSFVHLLSRRFNLGIRVSCYWGSRVHPPVMLRCPVLLCPPAHHIAPSASSLLACSSNYLPVLDVAVYACRTGRRRKPGSKCRSEAFIVEAARVLALYVLSGARGGTGRASYAFSVSVGYQSSCFLTGVIEHAIKIGRPVGVVGVVVGRVQWDFADVPACDDLVKGFCAIERIRQVEDIRDIPIPNILVEDFCLTV